jgi:hypothetical protein
MAKKSVKTQELSAVRMPGFNAWASLYTSPKTYRAVGGLGVAIGAVQPAYYLRQTTCFYCVDGECYTVPCKQLVQPPLSEMA